ncbi:MAG TPA: hypothetical protein DCQ90_02910 [Erysipelotrichaceae bacterium]|nr:hypothetical protein [Erysipelotrichaceae bacterium]
MWKKLASLFFEEEEEVVEEEIKETKTVELPPLAVNVEKKSVRIDLETTTKPYEAVKSETTGEVPVIKETPKTATRIDLSPEPQIKQRRSVNENNVVYEFQPVISPIFGVSEKDKKTVVVQNVAPQQPIRHSSLQTIISPIYGVAKKDEKHEQVLEPEFIVAPSNPTIEIKNLSLDELLHEETVEKEKTLEQFSLFEESTPRE